jgi:hypothetical protein
MDQTAYPPPPPPPPPPLPPTFAAAPPAEPPIPWETPGRPAGEALVETVKLFVTDMGQAFRRMPVAGDLAKPLLYAVIVGSVGPVLAQIYSLVLPNPFAAVLQRFVGEGSGELLARSAAAGLFGVFFVPIGLVIGLFLGAGIVHLCLMLIGGPNAGFMATLRVFCYSTTGQLAQVVPVIGWLLALVFVPILEIKGLAIAHRTSVGRATAAVLIPGVLCCVCIAVVAATVGAALVGMLSR